MLESAAQDLATLIEIHECFELSAILQDSNLVVGPEDLESLTSYGRDFGSQKFV